MGRLGSENFSELNGPWAQATGCGVTNGTANYQVIGVSYGAMVSHAGTDQFAEPSVAVSLGQSTLDGLNRMIFTSGRSPTGSVTTSWDWEVSFSRGGGANTLWTYTFPDTPQVGEAPFSYVNDQFMPHDFMSRDVGTVNEFQPVNVRVRLRPNDTTTDPVWWRILWVPSSSSPITSIPRGQIVTGGIV